ncbi:MAG: cytochrome c biogenesis protein CcdA [Leptospiraceae bacterium]|nr:cytochrome c biogenesis protein CcdA [Leptospiraceae bacterium]
MQEVFNYFLLSLGFGGLSLLTPCVFPLIPITISFFLKSKEGSSPIRDSILFTVGIILTFTFLGLLTSIFFGAGKLNQLASSPYLNLAIGILFLLFTFNLWGLYEIQLPSSILFFLSKDRDKTSVLGIFFVSLTFTLTTFTCTMPFLGTVLVSAAKGEWFFPLVGMFGYSLSFSIPFFFLALFPTAIQKLPKSGNWMVSFKIVLGFLELAAALKFFSNIDLVWNLGILTRSTTLLILAAIFTGLGLYLFGLYSFQHEVKKEEGKHPFRVLLSIAAFVFSYLFFYSADGKPLGELDAFLPPNEYPSSKTVNKEIVWIDNMEQARLESIKLKKPIFIDFTGYTCTNCRWMEQNIFPLPEVKELFQKFVLVKIYTDGDGEVYDKNQKYQEDKFKTIALPLYAGLSSNDSILGSLEGMTRDKSDFVNFLQKLLEKSKDEP